MALSVPIELSEPSAVDPVVVDDVEPGEVEEVLVEDVSIDGMCGVY
ncbi:MAG: mycofactocin precursor MftA [Dermatophilaceae bacterium]